jgi:hypothetical protein
MQRRGKIRHGILKHTSKTKEVIVFLIAIFTRTRYVKKLKEPTYSEHALDEIWV